MSRIASTFAALRARNERALVLYVTAGDPELAELPAIVDALVEGGADLIEIGLPFSDPIADGPTIQAGTQRALDRGVTPTSVLRTVGSLRSAVPLVLMGYYNPVLRFGHDAFAKSVADAGFDATIVTDLTAEEADDWLRASRANGLDNVLLAAPTSTDARLDEVCRRATGFVYAVSRTGVTGAGQEAPIEVQFLVRRLKARTQTPVCVGFGVSTPEHVRMVCEVADGAVVGSWLVRALAESWYGGAGRADLVRRIRDLKDATRG
ncbi:MAG: tryptophan synthase subunit alpha [Fimbriimonadaceae bacterium]|nr:tryptophan synthase subunit alpha [Fimbriimonadaceae bacterium]